MGNSSSVVTDTPKLAFDLSLRTSTTNTLNYLYEISHVLEDGKIPITDFPIVNPYTMFNKPQHSFKKTIEKIIGPSHPINPNREVSNRNFIKHSIMIYNREVSNRNFTIFRYMRDFIQVV